MEQITSAWEPNKALAPIVLFVYNRLEHTKKTVEALQNNFLADESEFYIFSDGPKDESGTERVSNVRSYIHTITGFKKVVIIERESNWGLARNVIDGVTSVVNKHGYVIVLEDDLITSKTFLKYMNEALQKYSENDQVMQISGHNFPVRFRNESNAFFMPMVTSWGWATWKRAWNFFDEKATGSEELVCDSKLRHCFDLYSSYDYTKMLARQKEGKIDSWAIRWYWTVFVKKGITLFPPKSLVLNKGMDGSGTHCGVEKGNGDSDVLGEVAEILLPTSIDINQENFQRVVAFLKARKPGIIQKMFAKLRNWIEG